MRAGAIMGLVTGCLVALAQPATAPGITLFGLVVLFMVVGTVVAAAAERIMQ